MCIRDRRRLLTVLQPMSINYTTEDIKSEEFLTKCFELSDKIRQTNLQAITITECQLAFYSKTVTEVMTMFKSYLQQLDGPTHSEDLPLTWKVYADKVGDKYRLKFSHQLVLKA